MVVSTMNPTNQASELIALADPALLWPKDLDNPRGDLMGDISGPDGLLPQFLRDFGKTLIDK